MRVTPATYRMASLNKIDLSFTLSRYRLAFTNFHMGYSCALAWILVVIIGLATAILFKTQNAWVHYEAE